MRLKSYPQYHDRSIPLHPAIPAHWDARKATRVFDRIGSGTTPSRVVDAYYDGDIPWVTTSELREALIDTTAERVTQLALEQNSALRVYQPGAVVIAMYGATIGRLAILGCRAAVNQACCVFDNSSLMENRYFYYWLWSYRPILISLSAGGGQPNLSQEDLKSLRVPIPPLEEQSAIVRFLDAKTAEIDALIAKKRRLLDLLAEQRAALVAHAVTKGLDAAVRLKPSGLPWFGAIPAHWEVMSWQRIARRVDVGIAEAATHAYADSGVPIIRTTNVKAGRFDTSEVLFVEEWFAERNRSKYLYAGDIITHRTGVPGTSAVVPAELDKSQCFTMLMSTLASGHVPAFFCAFLNSKPCAAYFATEAWGSAQQNISVPILKATPVPVPPPEEQSRIADFCERVDGKIGQREALLSGAVRELVEYRASLITAAVTGQIDVRNWSAKRAAA